MAVQDYRDLKAWQEATDNGPRNLISRQAVVYWLLFAAFSWPGRCEVGHAHSLPTLP